MRCRALVRDGVASEVIGREELLVMLDRPDVPLHTNDAENDIR